MRLSLGCFFSGLAMMAGCGGSSSSPPPPPPTIEPVAAFQDVSATNLPVGSLGGMCMDADHGDVDGDGDIDIVLAQEFATNLVLTNDGNGVFTLSTGAVGGGNGDNEDVRLRDFDGDTDLDMLTVHEDDGVHALLYNDGSGVFADVSNRLSINSIANATEVIDLNGDTKPDILLGNRGENLVLIQQANGAFADDTANRPIGADTTQDLLLVDVDGDGDADLYVANETANRLFINDGNGFFADESATRLPPTDGVSREADAADIDNDGDFDIIVANVDRNQPPANQLLLNDGNGTFSDVTSARFAGVSNDGRSFTVAFVDIDRDGDPDILSPNNIIGQGGTVDVWINDGSGNFSNPARSLFSTVPLGSVFDIEVLDVNDDGREDLYFCYRTGTDQLYIRR